MLLTDGELCRAIDTGLLHVDPFELDAVQPASIELRLGHQFRVADPELYIENKGRVRHRVVSITRGHDAEMQLVDCAELPYRQLPYFRDGVFPLYPGAFVLATTIEAVGIPNNMVARVEGRSTFGRLGLTVHVTAGFVDPGFTGNITLELANLGPNTLLLPVGTRICQMSVYECAHPAEQPYGKRNGSKYQGQTGPTAARSVP